MPENIPNLRPLPDGYVYKVSMSKTGYGTLVEVLIRKRFWRYFAPLFDFSYTIARGSTLLRVGTTYHAEDTAESAVERAAKEAHDNLLEEQQFIYQWADLDKYVGKHEPS